MRKNQKEVLQIKITVTEMETSLLMDTLIDWP